MRQSLWLAGLLDGEGCFALTDVLSRTDDDGDGLDFIGRDLHGVMHPDCAGERCELADACAECWSQTRRDTAYVERSIRDTDPLHRGALWRLRLHSLPQQDANVGGQTVLASVERIAERRTSGVARASDRRGPSSRASSGGHASDALDIALPTGAPPDLLDDDSVGIAVARDGRIVWTNARFAKIVKRRGDDLRREGLAFIDDGGAAPAAQTTSPPAHGTVTTSSGTYSLSTGTGEPLWLDGRVARTTRDGRAWLLVRVVDVTGSMHTAQELRRARRLLRASSRRLVDEQENERKRIARELHDGLGQGLSTLKFWLGTKEEEFARCERCAAVFAATTAELTQQLDALMEETRRIAMALRPGILDDIGLLMALRWLCRDFQSRHPQLRIDLDLAAREDVIEPPLKLAIYRIAQEALNNAAKHAQAASLRVTLDGPPRAALRLRIADDGRGFTATQEPAALPDTHGLGLGNMKERATLTGGVLTVHSGPAAGTIIDAVWPAVEREERPSG